jgi:hypothetical protein
LVKCGCWLFINPQLLASIGIPGYAGYFLIHIIGIPGSRAFKINVKGELNGGKQRWL